MPTTLLTQARTFSVLGLFQSALLCACASGADGRQNPMPFSTDASAVSAAPDAAVGPGRVSPGARRDAAMPQPASDGGLDSATPTPAQPGHDAHTPGHDSGTPTPSVPTDWLHEPDGEWQNIDDALVQRLTSAGTLPPKDQAAALKYQGFGPSAGVGCDPFTGALYLGLAGAGVWKSTDLGESFSLFVSTAMSGEFSGFLGADLDQPGRLAFFGADDDSLLTLDGGKTWTKLTRPLLSRGWNFGAVDWSSAIPKTVLAIEHAGTANRFLTTNGGQSFQTVREGDNVHSSVGVFDDETLITSDSQGIWRSADAGGHWTKVSDRPAYGSLMLLRHGIGYLSTERGLMMSHDNGLTWVQLGDTSHAFERGPWFESDDVIVAADASGFYLSTDRAAHWSLLGGWPEGFYDPNKPGMSLGDQSSACWDPIHHVAYVSDFKNIHKTDQTVGTFTGHTFRLRFR